jgi:hypothetical protein
VETTIQFGGKNFVNKPPLQAEPTGNLVLDLETFKVPPKPSTRKEKF